VDYGHAAAQHQQFSVNISTDISAFLISTTSAYPWGGAKRLLHFAGGKPAV